MGPDDDMKTPEKTEIFQGILNDPQRGDHFIINHFGTQVEIIVLARRKKDGYALLQVVQSFEWLQMSPQGMVDGYGKDLVITAERGNKLLANYYFSEENANK